MQRQFYCTNSTPLAVALSAVGVPFYDRQNPCTHLYTADWLAKNNLTIEQAIAQGIPGQIGYFFERTENLQSLLDAWNAQDAHCKQAVSGGSDTRNEVPDVTPEDAMRIICAALHNRGFIINLWKQTPPKLHIQREGSTFTVIGKNVSKEVKDRFNVK